MIETIKPVILRNPYDGHTHGRQGSIAKTVIPYTQKYFSGAEYMPNTTPNIIRLEDLKWYREEVENVIDANGGNFMPIFSFYLNPEMRTKELIYAWENGLASAVKYYPKGGTTESAAGLQGFKEVSPILNVMQDYGIPLLIHGETPKLNGKAVDDFYREKVFMETEMIALVKAFPRLHNSLEHISTAAAVDFVFKHENVVATITPQHFLLDRRALYNGLTMEERSFYYDVNKNGSYPSLVCRPILKNEEDNLAIQAAVRRQADEGWEKLYLGSDTAVHPPEKKYCEQGACGVYSAPIVLELYAMGFEQIGRLDHFQKFACEIGPKFYGIYGKLPEKIVTISPIKQLVPQHYDGYTTPFFGLEIPWTAKVA
jgi:dihydroorotase